MEKAQILGNHLASTYFYPILDQATQLMVEKELVTSDDRIQGLQNILKSIENIRKQVANLREDLSEKYAESIAENVSNCTTQ